MWKEKLKIAFIDRIGLDSPAFFCLFKIERYFSIKVLQFLFQCDTIIIEIENKQANRKGDINGK